MILAGYSPWDCKEQGTHTQEKLSCRSPKWMACIQYYFHCNMLVSFPPPSLHCYTAMHTHAHTRLSEWCFFLGHTTQHVEIPCPGIEQTCLLQWKHEVLQPLDYQGSLHVCCLFRSVQCLLRILYKDFHQLYFHFFVTSSFRGILWLLILPCKPYTYILPSLHTRHQSTSEY